MKQFMTRVENTSNTTFIVGPKLPQNTEGLKGPNSGTSLYQPNDVMTLHRSIKVYASGFHEVDFVEEERSLLPDFMEYVWEIG